MREIRLEMHALKYVINREIRLKAVAAKNDLFRLEVLILWAWLPACGYYGLSLTGFRSPTDLVWASYEYSLSKRCRQ